MNVEEQALARVKPTPEEEDRIRSIVDKLLARVMGTEAANGRDIQPYLVGSIAKDTYLKDPDADMFLLFDPKVPRDELEKVGLAIGREAIEGREHYAEHPYIKGHFMGLKADIVPAYRIIDSSQKMTAVDRTPFHTEFVKSRLAPELRDDVRLLKAFMKGIGTYGADARTEGFSGYLCELLVIKFGGFRQTLAAAARWSFGTRLEFDGSTARKFGSPLVFIDPVDPNRNVASALSGDRFATFQAAARAYTAEPKPEFYFPKPVPFLGAEDVRQKLAGRGDLLIITVPRPDLIDDILFPQMRKFERNIIQYLASADFTVMDSASHAAQGSLVIIAELQSAVLPEAKVHSGPPVHVLSNSEDFLAKWRSSPQAMSLPFIRDGCWHVLARRRHSTAIGLLRAGMQDLDAGKDLNKHRDAAVIFGIIPDDKEILEALSAYLDRRMPWER